MFHKFQVKSLDVIAHFKLHQEQFTLLKREPTNISRKQVQIILQTNFKSYCVGLYNWYSMILSNNNPLYVKLVPLDDL